MGILKLFETKTDWTYEMMLEESDFPLIQFLQYLVRNGERHSLKLKVMRKKDGKRIHEISFAFHEENEQIISLKELTLMGYQRWLEDPVSLMNAIINHSPFEIERRKYDEALEKLKLSNKLKAVYEGKNLFGFTYDPESMAERIAEEEKVISKAVQNGALLPSRITEIYREYLHELENPKEELPVGTNDHIEVELLTILSDEEVSAPVKQEAHQTLAKYREQKDVEKASEMNPKDNNALVAIRTIREHYLK